MVRTAMSHLEDCPLLVSIRSVIVITFITPCATYLYSWRLSMNSVSFCTLHFYTGVQYYKMHWHLPGVLVATGSGVREGITPAPPVEEGFRPAVSVEEGVPDASLLPSV